MEITVNPYLNFNGNTAAVMNFYKSVLGGDLTMQTFGDANMAEDAKDKDLIVHASLKSGSVVIMASDTLPSTPVTAGSNFRLSLQGQDAKSLTDIFDRLSQGGEVEMPLAKQFWGDTFGMLTDKFGIHWMVNIGSGQPPTAS
jgi:PhnB protein